jgi:tetratricopeptide (TPR) repeat protein
MENLYQLLGVIPFASFEDIQRSFNKLYGELFAAKDPLGNIPRLKALKDAFELLSNPEKRASYDDELKEFLEGLDKEFGRAVDALNEGDMVSSISILKECIRHNPREADYYETLGLAYQLKGELDEARSIFQQGLALNHKKGLFHWYLGDLYRALRDDERADTHFLDAAEEFKEMLKTDPRNFETMEFLADTYTKMKWFDEALEIYEKLIAQFPFKASYRRDVGAIMYELDLLEEAEENLQQALQNDPSDGSAFLYLGLSFFKRRLLGKASEYLEESLKLKPDQPEVRKLLEKIGEIRRDVGKTIEELIEDPHPDAMVEGTVKWYNPESGVGVLTCPEYAEVLLHYTAIAEENRENLTKGTPVSFGVVKDAAGIIAVEVKVLEAPGEGDTLPGVIIRFDSQRKMGMIKSGDGRELFFQFSSLAEGMEETLAEGQEVLFEVKSLPGLGDTPIEQAEKIRARKKK